jgi:hypothetical protein
MDLLKTTVVGEMSVEKKVDFLKKINKSQIAHPITIIVIESENGVGISTTRWLSPRICSDHIINPIDKVSSFRV